MATSFTHSALTLLIELISAAIRFIHEIFWN